MCFEIALFFFVMTHITRCETIIDSTALDVTLRFPMFSLSLLIPLRSWRALVYFSLLLLGVTIRGIIA